MCIFSDESLVCVDDKIYDFIFRLYNREAKKYHWNPAKKMTNGRKIILSKYIHDYTMDDVFLVLREIRKAKNFIYNASWFSLDWIIKEENLVKLMEGKYRDERFSNTGIKSQVNYTNRVY